MNKHVLTAIVLTSMAPSIWAVTYNDNITAIFGGGNPDTGWTSQTGDGATGNEIKLALRGKNRDTGATPQPTTLGTYEFATGGAANPLYAKWNYEFSIDSGALNLDQYDYFLSVDLDPSAGVSYVTFDPLAAYNDNEYGNSGTLNGDGVPGTSALAASNPITQNSQNIRWLGLTFLDATYNYELFAVERGAGVGGDRIADVGVTVVVGKGGAAVPDAGSTLSLLGLGMAGLAGLNFRKKK